MSFPSKFKGKCKDCGKEWPAKEPISKNSNGNWCKDGANCQACQQVTGTVPGPAAAATVAEDAPLSSSLKNFTRDQIKTLKIIEEGVKADLGPNENGQRIGMFVKEIYRSWTNKEEKS